MGSSLLVQFSEVVNSHGNKIALEYDGNTMSYHELDVRSNELANWLIGNLGAGQRFVAVGMERGFDQICAIIACLKAGASYVPLDLSYPIDRLQYMLETSGAEVLLCDAVYELSSPKCLNVKQFKGCRDATQINRRGRPGYVIFTSGSTGKPKGVDMGGEVLENLIKWQLGESRGGRTLQFTPVSFDVHFQEIFSTLLGGDTLVLINDKKRFDFEYLLQLIETRNIKRIFLPFVALNALCKVGAAKQKFPSVLCEVYTAGEQLRITDSIKTFFNATRAKLVNQYGPSETHVVTSYTLPDSLEDWTELPPIGKAVSGCKLLVLDSGGHSAKEGELYIGGICLANGYVRDKVRTDEKFLFVDGERYYRSGDIVKILDDGNLMYLGRTDGQVKIRGFRVELGELECFVEREFPSLEVVARLVVPEKTQPYLCLFVVGEFNEGELKMKLKRGLPEYMVPRFIQKVDEFPKTPSGKVDRASLTLQDRKRPELAQPFQAAKKQMEKELVGIWEELLQIKGIGVFDSFFDLGGSSLLALDLLLELQRYGKTKLSITDIFEYPTIKDQIHLIEGEKLQRQTLSKRPRVGDVAVIGVTGRFPGANSIEEFWNLLENKKSGLTKFTKEDAHPSVDRELLGDKNYVMAKGEFGGSDCFDHTFFGVPPLEAKLMDPQHRKFLELSRELLEVSGINPKRDDDIIGVYAGCAHNTYVQNFEYHPEKTKAYGAFNLMLANDKDYLPTRVAHKLGLKGPAISVNTGCSTSLVAIAQAVLAIRSGLCDSAIAGGIAVAGQKNVGYLHQEGSIYSEHGDCRPYDNSASGTVFSDGAGLVMLKSLEKAQVDGNSILAVVKGVGLNNDGSDKMSFTAPSVKGQKEAIKMALIDAGIDPVELEYIEGHGTATPIGDPIEIKGIKDAFGENSLEALAAVKCGIGSVKSNIGHTTAAAGAVGFIKCVQALQKGVVPGLANFKQANSQIDFGKVLFPCTNRIKLKSEKSSVAVSSFGVGGTNAHIILQGYSKPEKSEERGEELFLLSAKNEKSLEEMQKDLDSRLGLDSHIDTAYTLGRRDNFKFKSARTSSTKWLPISDNNTPKKVYFMFPGQGAQYVGMGRDLARRFPTFSSDLDKCFKEISNELEIGDFREVIWSTADHAQETLNNTLYAQPAIFAFEYCLGKLLLSLGIEPAGFIGHSIGEFAAATLNGVFSIEDAIKAVCKRSTLMANMPRGAMLSVALAPEAIAKELNNELQVAAVNGNKMTVVAGPFGAIEELESKLVELGIANSRLFASHAFHSKMMDPMLGEFESYLSKLDLRPAKIPMYSTVTGELETELYATPGYWAKHISNTVLFAPTISKIIDQESLFIEVGPRATLKTLATRQAGAIGKKTHCVALTNSKGESEQAGFLRALGNIWCLGNEFEFMELFEGARPRIIPTTTYAYLKTKHWLDHPVHKKETNEPKGNIEMEQTDTEILGQLALIFEEASGVDLSEYGAETSFLEMGLDSLFLTQISLKLKNEFGVEIGFRELTDTCDCVKALVARIMESRPAVKAPPKGPTQRESTSLNETKADENAGRITGHADLVEIRDVSTVEKLINDQIALMRSQLELLGGAGSPKVSTRKPAAEKALTNSSGTETKSFGAMAKIKKDGGKRANPKFVEDFIRNYNQKTQGSKLFTQNNRSVHADPRAVTGFSPESKEMVYPIVVKSSKAQRLIDVDGNEYVDMLCGFGSNFFGNGNQKIKDALNRQLDQGIEIGPQHPLTGEIANLISELTGNERSAFCNTGSEAVLGAMRIARTVTGKSKIVAFSNSYHGINDEVIVRGGKNGKAYPAAPGILPEAVSNMIILDYGTEEAANKIEELAQAGELAAVLVEPVQSRRCDFHPKDFLKNLRNITSEHGVCLIFDEVITGFRILPGGAQAYFGIRADLCVYGKIVGAGMPIGVISGKAKFMDALDGGGWSFGDTSVPEAGVTYFAGTFVRHPLALAAAKAGLEILKAGGRRLYDDLNSIAAQWVISINDICQAFGAPLRFASFGGLIKPKYEEIDFPQSNLFFAAMRYHGLHVYEGFPWFINLAHTKEDLEIAKNSIIKALRLLQENGVLSGEGVEVLAIGETNHATPGNEALLLGDVPPEPGARLGKDEKGFPAWFIESSEKQGVYIQL